MLSEGSKSVSSVSLQNVNARKMPGIQEEEESDVTLPELKNPVRINADQRQKTVKPFSGIQRRSGMQRRQKTENRRQKTENRYSEIQERRKKTKFRLNGLTCPSCLKALSRQHFM